MTMAEQPCLLTIGHSGHAADALIAMLQRHSVTAVADVRSQPYSRLHPQYNRETLAETLKCSGVRYVFLGAELGARRVERECYRGGQARYDRIATLPAFRRGLERLRSGAAEHRIALLCAEKDPITCHRTILVCRHLRSTFDIQHILEDGSLEPMAAAEERLLRLFDLPGGDLFRTREQLIEEAYDRQAERIAYVEGGAEVNKGS
jgi:uncharacterized protein (DUF488 family)